jgi:hypothetical protein
MPAPWKIVRAELAQAWGIPPWEVDMAPSDEIDLQLELWRLRAKNPPPDPRRGRDE